MKLLFFFNALFFSDQKAIYLQVILLKKYKWESFPGGSVVNNPPADAGETSLIPCLGRPHVPRSNQACTPQLLNLCSGARALKLLSPRAATTEA